MNKIEKKLKDYCIKTKIIIKEWRERYRRGNSTRQPFLCYSYEIYTPTCIKSSGGFKTKKELFKAIEKEF